MCASDDLIWTELSGRGVVYSFTTVYRAPRPELEDAVPYVVALVDLDEGARMMSQIVGCPPDQVGIGMRVEVEFRPSAEWAALPVFRLTDKGEVEAGSVGDPGASARAEP